MFDQRALRVPTAPGVRMHHLLTVFLNGQGGIRHVINGQGTPVSSATPGTPSTVLDYP